MFDDEIIDLVTEIPREYLSEDNISCRTAYGSKSLTMTTAIRGKGAKIEGEMYVAESVKFMDGKAVNVEITIYNDRGNVLERRGRVINNSKEVTFNTSHGNFTVMIDEYREYDITDVVFFKESFTETPLGYDPRNGISLQDIYRAEKSQISMMPNKTDTKGLIYFCTFDVEYAMINSDHSMYKTLMQLKDKHALIQNRTSFMKAAFSMGDLEKLKEEVLSSGVANDVNIKTVKRFRSQCPNCGSTGVHTHFDTCADCGSAQFFQPCELCKSLIDIDDIDCGVCPFTDELKAL